MGLFRKYVLMGRGGGDRPLPYRLFDVGGNRLFDVGGNSLFVRR